MKVLKLDKKIYTFLYEIKLYKNKEAKIGKTIRSWEVQNQKN